MMFFFFFFFFQAEDGIRDLTVTGVQTCALPISPNSPGGTTFMYTGYVKADALFTKSQNGEIADPSTGRDYYVPSTIPVGGVPTSTELNAHVKQTRLQLGTDTPVGADK